MKKFKIEITETLQKVVEIDANDVDDALNIAKQQYRNQNIILDDQDLTNTRISLFE